MKDANQLLITVRFTALDDVVGAYVSARNEQDKRCAIHRIPEALNRDYGHLPYPLRVWRIARLVRAFDNPDEYLSESDNLALLEFGKILRETIKATSAAEGQVSLPDIVCGTMEPSHAERLLRLLPLRCKEEILGGLQEMFANRVEQDAKQARLWYWSQALRTARAGLYPGLAWHARKLLGLLSNRIAPRS